MPRLNTFGFVILAMLSAGRIEAQLAAPVARPQLAVPVDAASQQIAALQQQVAALTAAVQALLTKTQIITIDPYGNYTISTPADLTIRGAGPTGSSIKLTAMHGVSIEAQPTGAGGGDFEVRAQGVRLRASTNADLWAALGTRVRGDAGTAIQGATVQINGVGGKATPAAVVGSMIAPQSGNSPSQVITGSSTVTIGN